MTITIITVFVVHHLKSCLLNKFVFIQIAFPTFLEKSKSSLTDKIPYRVFSKDHLCLINLPKTETFLELVRCYFSLL